VQEANKTLQTSSILFLLVYFEAISRGNGKRSKVMESKSCGVFDILSTRQMHGHIDMLVATDEYGSTLLHEVSCLHGVVVKD
jgi:hypothetical protein